MSFNVDKACFKIDQAVEAINKGNSERAVEQLEQLKNLIKEITKKCNMPRFNNANICKKDKEECINCNFYHE